MKWTFLLLCIVLLQHACISQDSTKPELLTLSDTLRGSVTPERAWWDVTRYDITVEPDFNSRSINAKTKISFKTITPGNKMQIDLQPPLVIRSVTSGRHTLSCTRNAGDSNVYYVTFEKQLPADTRDSIIITYYGKPRMAVNPPWDGGWIWKKDRHGNPWMSVACQGLGASVWYPCKDYQGDEPSAASLTIIVPDTLTAVGNGILVKRSKVKGGKSSYTWEVNSPINNYNIIPYIGKYVNWSETFQGEKGKLNVNYWVLAEDEQKAKPQFKQVPSMLTCFEHWFGPYPFYEDGYKLVQSPHLGMEHQSAIAYGNGFANGYLGKDLSQTGWGLKWDFIIVHESAHEWFANNITTKDIADMWIHEGFASYSEVLYTTCQAGEKAGNEYCLGLRKSVDNDRPVIGPYNVNKEGSIDMYVKGANIVHMVRQLIGDDEKFRSLLRDMNRDFYEQTTTSADIEKYISKKVGRDLSKMFDQYLRTIKIPVFQYSYGGGVLSYRWKNCVAGFDMPLKITAGKTLWIYPDTNWKTMPLDNADLTIDPNFYIDSKKM